MFVNLTSRTSGITRRIETAVSSPEAILSVGAVVAMKARWLVEQRRFAGLVGFLVEAFANRNPYYEWVRRRNTERFVEANVRGHRMALDPTNAGISRTLLSYGTHEHLSTNAFEDELRRLKTEIDGEITVLEIGANIGYFSLVEARVLGQRASIHAIEPAPDNAVLLERNVVLNGYEDVIDAERCAIGDTVEPVELHRSSLSNRHGVRRSTDTTDVPREPAIRNEAKTVVNTSTPSRGTVSVPQTTVDRFLADRGLSPDEVHVVRMDVEGYETAVFAGMKRVLEARTPLVIYMEFHQNYLADEATEVIVRTLADNGFEIVSAVNEVDACIGNIPRWYGRRLDIETFEDLLTENHYVELIVRR